jgi:hypothetical protein
VKNLGGLSAKKALLGLAVVIVAGGILMAFVSTPPSIGSPFEAASTTTPGYSLVLPSAGSFGATLIGSGSSGQPDYTNIINQGATVTEATTTTTTGSVLYGLTSNSTRGPPSGPTSNVTQGSPSGSGGEIEFSSQVQLQSSSPQQAASQVAALAYSVGGYVAYQATYNSSADVVIRVPAAEYPQALAKIEALGTVVGLTSNSNDVSVQYTDLNATLESLQTEQGALLRLLNESTTINSTLAIESQLQGVNQQINEVESQILQTRTLISYSTIEVSISESASKAPLSLALTTTPKSGESPLSVTFNAVVRGGVQPYVVNYNFGDATASQGQIVIHTYNNPGTYNVTVTATDQNGTAAQQSVTVRVTAAPGFSGFQGFASTVSALFVSVVEGIAEVAVVVLPIAAVGAVVVIPFQRRSRQKAAKQSG